MKSIFSSKSKNEKLFVEIDKRIAEIDKNVSLLFSISDKNKNSNSAKKIANISKELDGLYKVIFDMKNFNLDVFEYFFEKNIVNLFTSYVGLQNLELIKVIIPLLDKILFNSIIFCDKISMTEEILLVNSSVVNSLKVLIHTLVGIISEINYDEVLIDQIITLINKLLNKLIVYPNFYYAISSSNDSSSNTGFDSAIFELIAEVFSKEYLISKREMKATLRKSLLLCLNLEHFYTISISYLEKLLECLVDNLVKYYEYFRMFEPSKFINSENEKIIKKEKITNEELINLNISDLVSYLKYFSIITYCFSQTQLKKFLSNLLFNTLFIEYIQKDILNAYMFTEGGTKIFRIFEFIFYLTKYVKNKETNAILFYFLFGFNNFMGEDFFNNEMGNEEEQVDMGENLLSVEEIRLNIENLIKNNYNKGKFSNLNIKIDKSSHKSENILSFLITIIESSSAQMMDLKITLLNILTNLIKNCSNLFLVDILVPYYLHYINTQTPKSFEKTYEKIKSTRDKINLIEILKNVHPKYFSLHLGNWSEYFEDTLEKNYERNSFMLENAEIDGKKESEENDDESLSKDLLNTSQMFMDTYFFQDVNVTPRRNNASTNFTERSNNLFNDDENIEFSIVNDSGNGNSSKDKELFIKSQTISMRINFFDVLSKYFKRFHSNKYTENLYLTKLFLEIYSLPYLIHKGEQGESIYNIYSNVTFAGKKKFVLFSIGSVGTISIIKSKMDELVRFNFSKEEIDKLVLLRIQERMELDNPNLKSSNTKKKTNNNTLSSSNLNLSPNQKNIDFLDNLILFNEFFKEYISNIFAKCYFDQINSNYTKVLKELDPKFGENK